MTMTKALCSITAPRPDLFDPVCLSGLPEENHILQAEIDQLQPVVSAAVLTATAFRLRDHEALISALRLLVRVIRAFEDQRACA
jgi:hypothetical protein